MIAWHIQWNLANTDTNGTCHLVHIIQVSVLSGLSEKMSGTHVLTIKADISSIKRTLFNFLTLTVHDKAVEEEEGYEQ